MAQEERRTWRRKKTRVKQEIDAQKWSQLPEELLVRMLRYLPLSSLCRFKVVCKDWNSLLAIRPEEPYLLDIPRDSQVASLQHCYVYSLVTNIWTPIDLSFLLARLTEGLHYPPAWKPKIERCCSDGGLLCVWGKLIEPRNSRSTLREYGIIVCNPLTKRSKTLHPLTECKSYRPLDLVMRKESSSEFKVFGVLSVPHLGLRHFMYDSVNDKWLKSTLVSKPPTKYCSIIFEGVFYCIAGGDGELYDIFAQDIAQRCWLAYGSRHDHWHPLSTKIKLHRKTTQVSFVVSNNRLLLIAAILEEDLYFGITKVEMSSDATITLDVDSACVVSPPENFIWRRGLAFEHRDSIVFASDLDGKRTRGVDLLSLSADLKEMKPITPLVDIPKFGRYFLTHLQKVHFDIHATV